MDSSKDKEGKKMIKKILVGLSGTPYTSVAVERAVKLAKQLEAEVTGVTIVDLKRLAKIGLMQKGVLHAAKEAAEKRLQVTREGIEEVIGKFEAACNAEGIKYRVNGKKEKIRST